jgi:CRP-like cAMP-binding protein
MEQHTAASSGIALVSGRPGQARLKDAMAASPQAEAAGLHDAGGLWPALLGNDTLSVAECEALDALAKPRMASVGQSLFSHLSPAHALVALCEGEVALGLRTSDGTFRTERIVRGPAWLDLSSAWLDEAHAMDARASTAATVLELDRHDLAECLQRHPKLALQLIHVLAREVKALAVNTHELMHKDAPARLAQWLSQRCTPVAGREGQGLVQLHERKRDVASQLAITPETLSRLMRSFTRLGVIEVAGYTVRVLDIQALERMAQA